MAIIMLGFMLNMYKSRAVNTAVFVGAALAFALTTWLVRSQVTVSGIDYMQAMIPHHSIDILTSERAGIEEPRVRKLGRRDHRVAAKGDRRDEVPHSRHRA